MSIIFYSHLIFLLLTIIFGVIEGNVDRYRRQIIDGTNRNVAIPQQRPDGTIPSSNVPFNPSNNPNIIVSNERNNLQQQPSNTNQLSAGAQSQVDPTRSRGYYNSPQFQPPPFTGEKPSGWFGTSHVNWVSNQDGEVDKNKLAAGRTALPNNPQTNYVQPQREDGGPHFLAKVAKQYASKGQKAFNFGQFETREGRGSVCFNHENFDGYIYGRFPCPLPASTGMNQLDQFCCGLANYQYCCNAQEFSQTQRGFFSDSSYIGDQRIPKRTSYPSSTRRILAIVLPIAGFIVISGIGILVFLYYKKFRKEQNRTGKPAGAIRLEDNYSIVPQEPTVENDISLQDEP